MRHVLGVIVTAAAVSLAPAATPAVPSLETLVERLGDPGYRERDAAAGQLLARGADALPLLERAARVHADPEVRWRSAALAEQLRRTTETTRLLAARPVRLDYDRVPLNTAVADFRKQTGIPLVLDERSVADPTRVVTVRTGELTAWEALEVFCRSAGLVELFREELGGGSPAEQEVLRQRRIAYAVPSMPPPETAGQVPVVLGDGMARRLPGERGSAVRILALPPSFPGHRVIRGAGEIILNLDITPLPGIRWDGVTTVRVLRAVDETGRPLTASHRIEPPASPFFIEDGVVLGGPGQVFVMGGAMGEFPMPGGFTRPNPRIVPVTLRTEDRSIRRLAVFEGVIVGEVIVPNQPLVTLDALAKSPGASGTGPGDLRVSLLSYQNPDRGPVVLKIRTENPNPWTMQRLGRRAFGQPLGLAWEAPGYGQLNGGNRYQFYDAAGNRIAPAQRTISASDDGMRQTSEMEFQFPATQSRPDRLVVTGDRLVVVEVPFKLRDVPLP